MTWEMDGIIPNLVEYIQQPCQSRISSLDKSLTLQEWPQPASATPNSKCQKIHCCFPAAIVPGGTAHPCPRIWREPCQTWCKISNNDANKEFQPKMVHCYCINHKPAPATLQNSQKINHDFFSTTARPHPWTGKWMESYQTWWNTSNNHANQEFQA